MPTFSIIIPCRNSARTLASTLASMIDQSFEDWEAIAIDDGSTDETAEILAAVARTEPRLRVVGGSGGRGPSAARNLGIRHASADLIAFLDSDDIWNRTRLAKMNRFLQDNPETDIAYSQYAFFTETPCDSRTVSTVSPDRLTVLSLLKENVVGTMSNLIIRRAAMERIGFMRSDLSHGEDREWLVRAAAKGCCIRGLDEKLLHYRTSSGGLSSDLSSMFDGWRESVTTARSLAAMPSPSEMREAEAVYLRYLARRSLRLGLPPSVATGFAVRGALLSQKGFFRDGKRGALTLGAALAANIAPATVRSALSHR